MTPDVNADDERFPQLDLDPDELLTTTRSVKKRLDLTRPVPQALLLECLEIAQQAPSGGNAQSSQWMIVTDSSRKAAIADLYRRGAQDYVSSRPVAGAANPDVAAAQRLRSASAHLTRHMRDVPALVIPCMRGRVDGRSAADQAAMWGSTIPAVWSFVLALRARGLGSTLTAMHLNYEREVAELLSIPYEEFTQVALLPVAYTLGTSFRKAVKPPIHELVHVNSW